MLASFVIISRSAALNSISSHWLSHKHSQIAIVAFSLKVTSLNIAFHYSPHQVCCYDIVTKLHLGLTAFLVGIFLFIYFLGLFLSFYIPLKSLFSTVNPGIIFFISITSLVHIWSIAIIFFTSIHLAFCFFLNSLSHSLIPLSIFCCTLWSTRTNISSN